MKNVIRLIERHAKWIECQIWMRNQAFIVKNRHKNDNTVNTKKKKKTKNHRKLCHQISLGSWIEYAECKCQTQMHCEIFEITFSYYWNIPEKRCNFPVKINGNSCVEEMCFIYGFVQVFMWFHNDKRRQSVKLDWLVSNDLSNENMRFPLLCPLSVCVCVTDK